VKQSFFSTEGVAWKSYYFFGKSFVPWSDIKDLSDSESSTLFLLLLFLAPSIAFWIGITFLLFYIALILIFSVLAFLVPRIWRHTISYNHALKLCLFAATVCDGS
jgi:cellulose synthase/poly-beta-1,6-N-acetylglucosamine synthase-like glycosyltransferase